MLNNFRNLNSLYRSLGARWLMFRVGYALRMRTGIIRKLLPAYAWKDRPLATWLKRGVPSEPEAYARWRKVNSPRFLFERVALPDSVPWDPQAAVDEAERILSGELKYFAHKFVRTGFPPDWHADPVSGKSVAAGKHWSQISNEGAVDIKFIWESSRFSMVYTLVRAYTRARDPRIAEAFWRLVESWAGANPPNTGPHWMDGQEAALRLMAWMFGYYAFPDAPSTTSERVALFTVLVAAHAERIDRNIDYAIYTRSNHAISEAFGLWLVGLLFPELNGSGRYFQLGQRLLEEQCAAQIFPDGTYSMYSLNYHRFVLHMYFWMMRLGELNQSPVSGLIQQRVSRAVEYLSALIDPETGQMPVYGSNDGALVLPLNNCDFTDYRPVVQLGSYVTKKELPFAPGPWDEDIFWLFSEAASLSGGKRAGVSGQSRVSFPHGGTYILRGPHSKAVIRCSDFRSRPSHADQLHVDLWWHGTNIACDAGTYLYSGAGIWRNGLAHTSVHNTVIVDHQDQMRKTSRFIWTDWAKGTVLQHTNTLWQGEHDGYRRLPDPVSHRRTVVALEHDRWLVVDHLAGQQPHLYGLHWLLSDVPYEARDQQIWLALPQRTCKMQVGLLEGSGSFSIRRADLAATRGWRSRYYADKEPAISVQLAITRPQACFWTFVGLEDDLVEVTGQALRMELEGREVSIPLG